METRESQKQPVKCIDGFYRLIKNCEQLTHGQHAGEYVKMHGNHNCFEYENGFEAVFLGGVYDGRATENVVLFTVYGRKFLREFMNEAGIIETATGYYEERSRVVTAILDTEGNTGLVSRRDAIRMDDGNYFADHDIARDHGYDMYEEFDDAWLTREQYDERIDSIPNADYHKLTRADKRLSDKNWSIGFEIEKEDGDEVRIPYKKVLIETGWCKENDGSLDDATGYELVSPIFSLYDAKSIENDLRHPLINRLVNGDYSDSCGGHINVGHREYSGTELFEGFISFMPLLYALYPDRINGEYCVAKDKRELYNQRDKYQSVYRKNKLIEFRIFPAVKNVQNLRWRYRLIRIMVDNFGKSEIEVLHMMVNKKSRLNKLLSEVYSPEKILQKVNLFIQYSREYNDKVISLSKPKK